MGMFDYFSIRDPAVLEKVQCAHGHAATERTEFQTKGMECSMHTYMIINGQLRVLEGGWMAFEETAFDPPPYEDAEPVDYTGEIRFHGDCDSCEPTYWIRDKKEGFMNWVQDSKPLNDYVAIFYDGELMGVKAVNCPTLEEDAAKMHVSWIQTDKKGVPLKEQS